MTYGELLKAVLSPLLEQGAGKSAMILAEVVDANGEEVSVCAPPDELVSVTKKPDGTVTGIRFRLTVEGHETFGPTDDGRESVESARDQLDTSLGEARSELKRIEQTANDLRVSLDDIEQAKGALDDVLD